MTVVDVRSRVERALRLSQQVGGARRIIRLWRIRKRIRRRIKERWFVWAALDGDGQVHVWESWKLAAMHKVFVNCVNVVSAKFRISRAEKLDTVNLFDVWRDSRVEKHFNSRQTPVMIGAVTGFTHGADRGFAVV